MNDRRLSEAQIAIALRAHLPTAAQAGLRERAMEAVEITSQQRPLPSFLGALTDADPAVRRRSLLIAAALLLGLALASAAAVGAWRLLQRDTVPELNLAPPRASNGWIAYVRQPFLSNAENSADIYLVREGVEPRLIAGGDFKHGRNACPSFSPDGTKLAYAEGSGPLNGGGWDQGAVVVIGVDAAGSQVGSETRIPVPGPVFVGLPCPHWSADGRRVAYLINDDGPWITGLNGDTPVIPPPELIHTWHDFAWSPVDEEIAGSNASGLWLVPTDGGPPRLIRRANTTVEFGDLSWSPDGSRIAVSVVEDPVAVRVIRVDESAADFDLKPGFRPVWSPSGDRIAYSSGGVVIVDADGSHAHPAPPVAAIPGQKGMSFGAPVIWSPDGRRFLSIGLATDPADGYALVSTSVTGDSDPVVLTQPSMDLDALNVHSDLSWQPVFP